MGVKCSWDMKCSKQKSVSVDTQGTVFCVHECVGRSWAENLSNVEARVCSTSADSNKMSSWLDLKWMALHSGRKVGTPAALVGRGIRFCRRCPTAAQSHDIKGRVQFSPFAEQQLWEQAEHIPFLLGGLWNSY